MRVARWAYLLEEDAVFRRWYENLARGSKVTAKERARVLYRFTVLKGMTVGDLVEMGKRDVGEVEDLLMDFVSELHREGKAPGYIENYLKSVKSWLEFNSVKLVRKIKIGNRGSTPTLEDERVPTPDELLQILGYAQVRGRCSVSLMALSGVRPEVLGNVDGSEGLELRDLPDVRVEGGRVYFERMPITVRVRAVLSKAKHRYFTFLGAEGCDYLKAYLEKRMAQGEELDGRSAIIAVKAGHESRGFRNGDRIRSMHVTTKTVTNEIRNAMRPRFKWRPYVLRSYFDTMLLIAENNGKISHAYRQFYMGHVGDIEARYTVNKGRLPEALIEDMRRRFNDSEEYLTTRKARDENEVKKKWFMDLIKSEYPEHAEEIENIIKISTTYEDSVIQVGEWKKEQKKSRKGVVVHSMDEVERLLGEGWADVMPLANGSFFVKRD